MPVFLIQQLPRVSRTESRVCWWLPRCFFFFFSPFLRALPERLRSQEAAGAPSWSCASLAATQGAPPPPPALASSVHSRAPAPPGTLPRHSWAGSDSSAQLEGAQLRARMEGGAARTLRDGGRGGWEGSGSHQHRRSHRPTPLPQEEMINLLGIKSAASQKASFSPMCWRKGSQSPQEPSLPVPLAGLAHGHHVMEQDPSHSRMEHRFTQTQELCSQHGTCGTLAQRCSQTPSTTSRGRVPLPDTLCHSLW